jgi:hypothetical protein
MTASLNSDAGLGSIPTTRPQSASAEQANNSARARAGPAGATSATTVLANSVAGCERALGDQVAMDLESERLPGLDHKVDIP